MFILLNKVFRMSTRSSKYWVTVMQSCELEASGEKAAVSGDNNASMMRLAWALVHSRNASDVQRGIAMLEGKVVFPFHSCFCHFVSICAHCFPRLWCSLIVRCRSSYAEERSALLACCWPIPSWWICQESTPRWSSSLGSYLLTHHNNRRMESLSLIAILLESCLKNSTWSSG